MDYLVAAAVPPVCDVPLEPVSLEFPDTEPEPHVLEEAAQRYRLGGFGSPARSRGGPEKPPK